MELTTGSKRIFLLAGIGIALSIAWQGSLFGPEKMHPSARVRNVTEAELLTFNSATSRIQAGDIFRIDGEPHLFKLEASTTPGDGGITKTVHVDGLQAFRAVRQFDGPVHVDWYGATPNDSSDDDSVAINAAAQAGKLKFSTGRYHIDNTVSLGSRYGVVWSGEGVIGFPSDTPAFDEVGTALVWKGADGGTCIATGGNGWKLQDISVWGRLPASGTRAAIGLHQLTTAGIGSGVSSIENVTFNDLDSCVQAGTALGDSGSADIGFHDVRFRTCVSGLVVKHLQGMNYLFYRLLADNVEDSIFDFEAGGQLTVYGCTGSRVNRVLRIRGSGTNTGINNGTFSINDVWFDGTTWGNGSAFNDAPTLLLADTETGFSERLIDFNRVRFPALAHQWDAPIVNIKGEHVVKLSGIVNIKPPPSGSIFSVTGNSSAKSQVILEDSFVIGTPTQSQWITTSGVSSQVELELRNVRHTGSNRLVYGTNDSPIVMDYSLHNHKIVTTNGAGQAIDVRNTTHVELAPTTSSSFSTFTNAFKGQILTVSANDLSTLNHGTGTDAIELDLSQNLAVGTGGWDGIFRFNGVFWDQLGGSQK